MSLGLHLGLRLGAGAVGAFSPASLFAAGEQGYWLDPSDFTTMFQDAAGTTPVTATGQSVRRINDKSGRGNNFTQANVANAPILGREPAGGTRNLLTFTEEFDNAAWVKTNQIITPNSVAAPDGTITADTLNEGTANGTHNSGQLFSSVSGTTYTSSVYLRDGDGRFAQLLYANAGHGTTAFANFDLQTGTVGTVGATATASITDVGGGWYRCVLTATATSTISSAGFNVVNVTSSSAARGQTYVGTNKFIYVWGAQLELGSVTTAYQRVTDQWNVTQAGVPDCYYVAFDGTDDWLQSAATINPGAVDKAQVFAGARKLSDAGFQPVIMEASVSSGLNNGTIALFSNSGGGAPADYSALSRGTANALFDTANTFAAPITNVLAVLGDISGDSAILRVNGAQQASSAADQGTGNYLTYAHYIGRRGGTSNPFNGRVYQMVMRFGANLTAGQITQTETFVNSKTGAY